jgi:hypothetical protein
MKSAAIAIACFLLAVPAAADWPSQGRRVVEPGGIYQTRGAWIFDLPSGDLLVRATGQSPMSLYISVQSVTPAGEIAPGWPGEGVYLGPFANQQPPSFIGFAVDPNGFTWEEAGDLQATAYAVSPMGVLAPFLFALSLSHSAFAPAPSGIYASFGDRVQRFTEAGVVAPGWPANGVSYVGTYGEAALPDGSGGVVVMALETTPLPGPLALRVDSRGVKHAGRRLSYDDDDAHPEDHYDVPPLPALLPSDASHYFAVWSTRTDSADDHVKVQRVGYDSALAPGWPTGGLVAVAPHTIFHVTPLPDHAGGLYLVWYQDDGLPRATHMRPDGTFVPGTDANGVVLFPPGPLREPQTGFDGGILPYMVADVTPDGRLIFAWDDVASGNGIRVQWLRSDLTADPSEPVEGRLIMPNPEKTAVRAVHAAPDGGAYVAWNSATGAPGDFGNAGEIWMTRILPSSLVGVAPHATALALSAPRPNPARGAVALDVTLPDDSPARVELLDVAGRVVRALLVQGAGAHAVSFGDLVTLAPGLYFARAVTRGATSTTRVVVSR